MSRAVNRGRWQLGTSVLSRRRAMRRWRLANCWRILVFTRNPSGVDGAMACNNHETPEKPRDFGFFRKSFSPQGGNLACLRSSPRSYTVTASPPAEQPTQCQNDLAFDLAGG